MLVEERLNGVERRLGHLENMVQVVIDGGKELDENLQSGLEDIRSEIDKQNDLIVDMRRKLLQRIRPRTLFVVLLVIFFLWCIFLYWIRV